MRELALCNIFLDRESVLQNDNLLTRNTVTIINNPLGEAVSFLLVVGLPPSMAANYLVDHLSNICNHFNAAQSIESREHGAIR
jgi:hypothetical protein